MRPLTLPRQGSKIYAGYFHDLLISWSSKKVPSIIHPHKEEEKMETRRKKKKYASIKFFVVQIVQDSVNKTWITFKVRDILNEMNSTYAEERIGCNEQCWLFERKFARGLNENFKTKYLLSAWVTFSSSSLFLLSISSILPRKRSRSCSLKKSSFIIARDSVRISSTFFWESRTPSFRLWKCNGKSVSQQLYTSLL